MRFWFRYPFERDKSDVVEDKTIVVEEAVEEAFVEEDRLELTYEFVFDILIVEGRFTEKFETVPWL
ncbi:hypothetical protein JCM8795_01850 [Hydrogenobaculum acidophilum]